MSAVEIKGSADLKKICSEFAPQVSAFESTKIQTESTDLPELEEETRKLKEIQKQIAAKLNYVPLKNANPKPSGPPNPEEQKDIDSRSVYVGNVDYSATEKELEAHFNGCGAVSRITILRDKFRGTPKGFAYIEFAERDGAQNAISLSLSLFRGRQIKVDPKRTNKPGVSSFPFAGRGRGRGRGNSVKYVYGRPMVNSNFKIDRRPGFAPY